MPFASGERVLVTGGAGYVGSHACKALARHGIEPVVYDDLSTGHRDFVRWGPLIEGDIRDGDRLVEAMKAHRIGHVLHFAAESLIGKSSEQPELFYDVNVGGTLALLAAMLKADCPSLVISSSCAVFGVPPRNPVPETAPHQPVSVYGRSKAIVEAMLDDYRSAHGLRITALRYFNAAGADPGGEIGERHRPETHLIPRAIAAALGGNSGLAVYGTDYPTPDGTAVRDYIHVTDLADAHIAALARHAEGDRGAAYNVGAGRGYSVKAIIAAVTAATGNEINVTFAERRPGDPPELVADASLAASRLGFAPKWSELDAIVGTAVAWHRKDGWAV